MGRQDGHGALVKGQAVPLVRLCIFDHDSGRSGRDNRPLDVDSSAVPIKVTPLKTDHFPAPAAAGRRKPEIDGIVEIRILHFGQELSDLGR